MWQGLSSRREVAAFSSWPGFSLHAPTNRAANTHPNLVFARMRLPFRLRMSARVEVRSEAADQDPRKTSQLRTSELRSAPKRPGEAANLASPSNSRRRRQLIEAANIDLGSLSPHAASQNVSATRGPGLPHPQRERRGPRNVGRNLGARTSRQWPKFWPRRNL